MADVRVNGKRFPVLQAVDSIGVLISRLDAIGDKQGTALTSLSLNNSVLDLDNPKLLNLKVMSTDTVEALMESASQLALQSMQVAQEMAELLTFDLKVATLNLWENTRNHTKVLETLIGDCHLFLTLGARPMELLCGNPYTCTKTIENCLRQLDKIANNVEDTVLLAANGKFRESCHILVARVMPAIELWLKLSHGFTEELELDKVEFRFDTMPDTAMANNLGNAAKL